MKDMRKKLCVRKPGACLRPIQECQHACLDEKRFFGTLILKKLTRKRTRDTSSPALWTSVLMPRYVGCGRHTHEHCLKTLQPVHADFIHRVERYGKISPNSVTLLISTGIQKTVNRLLIFYCDFRHNIQPLLTIITTFWRASPISKTPTKMLCHNWISK